jgi:hypothetical protein
MSVIQARAAEPYADDAEYLGDVVDLLLAEAKSLSKALNGKSETNERRRGLRVVDDAAATTRPDEVQDRRDNLANRVEASREAGRLPRLERLAEELALAPIEVLTLRLVVASALGKEFEDALVVAAPEVCGGTPTPETVARLARLDLRRRFELRRRLGPSGVLQAAGLVEVDLPFGEGAAGFWSADIRLREAALARVVGDEMVGR